jgi:hypothetical protein
MSVFFMMATGRQSKAGDDGTLPNHLYIPAHRPEMKRPHKTL